LGVAAARGCAHTDLRTLADWLPLGRIDQKRRDADTMLREARSHLAANARPLSVNYELSNTVTWEAARRSAEDGLSDS
jgi:hypothetical protein